MASICWSDGEFALPTSKRLARRRSGSPEDALAAPMASICWSDGELAPPRASGLARW
jgi:hypothetical protein